ncbi:MAG: serine/threonine-protein phosphatase [Lachnospiraceae bacterium]|nr:serine/threonine-protein phosphatase [Lachnospiraceae bacterium]
MWEKIKLVLLCAIPFVVLTINHGIRYNKIVTGYTTLDVINFENTVWITELIIAALVEAVYFFSLKIVKERVRLDTDLETARRVQYGMVPSEHSFEGKGFEVAAVMQSARNVGGDFYDVISLDKNRTAIVIGDVSGKGISAALFMSTSRRIIRDALFMGCGPSEVLKICNKELCEENPEGMFLTAFVAVFDNSDNSLTFGNAGHCRPVLIKEKCEFLSPDPGMALALFDGIEISEGRLELGQGEGILLYTDGVIEAVDIKNEQFGEGRLLSYVSEKSKDFSEGRASRIVHGVKDAVFAFAGSKEQFDDITEVALIRMK